MQTKAICCWNELAEIAHRHSRTDWIFRGVEVESFDLIPKIGRERTRLRGDGDPAGFSIFSEKAAIDRFKREARPHLTFEPQSALEWLSIAQHHGLPTRLLDWTESPLVAVYFAVKPSGIVNQTRVDAALYGLPAVPTVEDDAALASSSAAVVAYFPRHVSPRITGQRGLFTWHRTPAQPWQPDDLVKWIIPSKVCYDLKATLNKCGINQASMFPDLDGIADHVEWLLKWRFLPGDGA